MNTPDTPKTWNDKRMILSLAIGIICGMTFTDKILHVEQWWLHLIVAGATTGVVTCLVLWIAGRLCRG